MVLQQKTEATLWGKAEPDSKIVITTTWSKKKVTVIPNVNYGLSDEDFAAIINSESTPKAENLKLCCGFCAVGA